LLYDSAVCLPRRRPRGAPLLACRKPVTGLQSSVRVLRSAALAATMSRKRLWGTNYSTIAARLPRRPRFVLVRRDHRRVALCVSLLAAAPTFG
jgi:hypothetical protein